MHIIYFLLATLMITNYSFAQTPEEYFVREKSKGFIGKVGKSGIFDRYRDTMVLHEASDGQVTIYGVAYMPSYTRRPYIISIKFDSTKNSYMVGHTSRAFESISDLKLIEIEGTKKLFLVAQQDFDHKLVELDLDTLNVISNKKIPNVSSVSIPGFEYEDADNDGIKEFVFGSSGGLQGLDPENLEEKFVISFDNDIFKVDGTLYRPGTNSFKIDNVDSDSNNEIIVNGFPSVIEVNPSLEMKLEMRLWSLDYNYNPPMFFNTHDLDNDGRKELIVATQNPEYTTSGWLSHIRIFDVEKKEMVQLIDTELPIMEHVFFDIDKDGVDEIVTTSDRYDVIAYNYETGQVHTQFALDGYGCAGLLFGDFNYDDSDEFFVSCGLNGTMPGHNYIVNLAGQVEWYSNDLSGPIFLGNPEGGKTEDLHVLTSRQNDWHNNGKLFKLDADNFLTKWNSNKYIYNEQGTQDGYKDLAVFDYDNNGVNEAYFGVQSFGTIYLNQVDSKTNELMSKITIELSDFGLNDENLERHNAYGLNISKLKSFDFDRDGNEELIIGTQGRNGSAYKLKVIVFDLSENQIIAEYTIDNVGSIENIIFEDLDGDGKDEVIILQGYITVLNPEKNTISYSQENYYSSITKDLDKNLYYAGSFEGSVFELSENLMNEQKQHRVCGPGEIYYEDTVIDLRIMPNESILVLCREHLTMYDVANDEVIGDYYIGRGLLGAWRDMYIYEESDFINIIFDTYHSIEHFRDNDNDNDKIGNIIDDDDDNDGIGDRLDNCPLVSNPNQIDTDGDGDGDICDTDDDNDGINDQEDAFPLDPSENADFDGDGIGDNADPDDDNDGMPDEWEEQYGLNPYDSSDRSTDLDNDGISNYQEYVNGTNPTVANNNSGGGNDNPPSSDSGGGGSIPILLLIILSSYFGFRLRRNT